MRTTIKSTFWRKISPQASKKHCLFFFFLNYVALLLQHSELTLAHFGYRRCRALSNVYTGTLRQHLMSTGPCSCSVVGLFHRFKVARLQSSFIYTAHPSHFFLHFGEGVVDGHGELESRNGVPQTCDPPASTF